MEPDQNNRMSLPFFPLGIVVMPGEKVPLRIFEPRYKQLINECKQSGVTFGVPFVKNGKLLPFGTEVKLNKIVSTAPEGEMVIVIEGMNPFQVLDYNKELPGKLYGGGEIKYTSREVISRNAELLGMLDELGLRTIDTMDPEDYSKVELNKVVMSMELNAEDKYMFISLETDRQKEKFLSGLLSVEKRIREQEKLLDEQFQLN